MQWESRGSPRSWGYSTRWGTALFSTRTARRGWFGEKEFTKECLITLSGELSLASSGLQLLPQAVLQPDRRNFYGQSHWTAPRLDLERQSDGVDTRDCVHSRCKQFSSSSLDFHSTDFRLIAKKNKTLNILTLTSR